LTDRFLLAYEIARGRERSGPNDRREVMSVLRLVSYLSPSLPEGLFEAVARRISETTGIRTSLRFERQTSAPSPAEDPFSSGRTDIGFLCSPGYVRLSQTHPPAVTLLGAAAVFEDPRTEGRPVYFSDVIVASSSAARSFEDLRGRTWAYNDPCSWSGYLNLLRRLRGVEQEPFFGALRASGSHISVRLVAAGEVDGSAVDSNALALLLRREPMLKMRIRVLESWGPHAVQPIVLSCRMSRALGDRIGESLREMHLEPRWAMTLRSFGVVRFATVRDDDYSAERQALRELNPLRRIAIQQPGCIEAPAWA
jgi:phosphonate transport system substrate-binding protein